MDLRHHKVMTLKKGVFVSFLLTMPLLFDPSSLRAAISTDPLFLTANVPPNIMLIIDDSGSMDSEVLLPTNDGALWWHTGDRSFVGRNNIDVTDGSLNYNQAGTANDIWKKYVYLFPNGTGTGNRVYSDSTNDHYAVPPIGPFAYLRSSDYNGMYYDTTQDYTPWVSAGGYTFSGVAAGSAPSDPNPDRGSSTVVLDNEIENAAGNHVFRFHAGMVIPQGTYYRDWSDSSWKTAPVDREVTDDRNVPVRYYPATFYQRVVSDDTYSINGDTGVCNSPNPAHYSTYVATPSSFSSSDVDVLAPDGSCLKRYEIKTGITFPSGRDYDAEMQNFANWFSYTRKRHLALRNGAGKAFDEVSRARVGGYRINNLNLQGMWDIDTEKNTFYNFLYNAVGSGGTPNREALNYAGQQYNTNANVITERCQKNFVLLFTDGFANVWTGAGVGNVDLDDGEPYADTHSNTNADIAMHYYQGPLRAGLPAGDVPVSRLCGTDGAPPWLDCNSDLHMVTYGITLGARGNIFGVTHQTIADAYNTPPSWQIPATARNPVQVDDLYHACVNARGELLNANNAAELTDALSTALKAILSQSVGSAAAIATNSTRLIDNTLIYQARFDSSDWSGSLLAYEIGNDGSLESVRWSTDMAKIPTYPSRAIYSWDGSDGISFAWGSLSTDQQALLTENKVNWLRGDQSNEGSDGLRIRTKILGDIINSDPLVVGVPNFHYELLPVNAGGGSYAAFRLGLASRPSILYVGGNDGMLHAFDAETGDEKFAYVPAGVYENLANLTLPEYEHKFYVDGSPAVGDAFIDNSWKTILVGGLGAGGRSIYALDVTNPLAFNDSKVLWEFGYADEDCEPGVTACRDIGYTFGKPVLARMQNGDWAVIFSNGYESDGYKAKLFIVNAANGQLIRAIDAGTAGDSTTRNGLSAPALLADATQTITSAYAGDLHGNLWKFDLTSTSASFWHVAFKDSSDNDVPLFVTQSNQPITAPLNIGVNENGGHMIYFGTGKYFEVNDNDVSDPATNPGKQSFYGVWDIDDDPRTLTDLVEQTIIHEGQLHGESDNDLRIVSNNPVVYEENAAIKPYGWYLDLVPPSGTLQGERVVSAPLLRRGRVVFTTLIPDTDSCSPGGGSWLLELDAMTGGRLISSVLDVNKDGDVTEGDFVVIVDPDDANKTISVSVSGRKSTVGIVKTPAVIEAGTLEFKYFGGSDGQGGEVVDGEGTGVEIVREAGGEEGEFGRRSWRQLR